MAPVKRIVPRPRGSIALADLAAHQEAAERAPSPRPCGRPRSVVSAMREAHVGADVEHRDLDRRDLALDVARPGSPRRPPCARRRRSRAPRRRRLRIVATSGSSFSAVRRVTQATKPSRARSARAIAPPVESPAPITQHRFPFVHLRISRLQQTNNCAPSRPAIHRGKPLVSHDRLGETRRRTGPPRHPCGSVTKSVSKRFHDDARVFISHRPGDGAGQATALRRGARRPVRRTAGRAHRQADAACRTSAGARRWPERLAAPPILVAARHARVVGRRQPHGRRRGCAPSSTPASPAGRPDPASARRRRRPVTPGADLPAPFERLSRLRRDRPPAPRRVARATSPALPKTCAGWACARSPARNPAPCRCPARRRADRDADARRRGAVAVTSGATAAAGVFGLVAAACSLVGGWGVWRWRQRRAASLSGIWRAQHRPARRADLARWRADARDR